MVQWMILGAIILLACIFANKLLYRFGVPTLLIFLLLGMLFGSDVLGVIAFDDYDIAQKLCSIALLFIMFQGGFSTNWRMARPVAAPAIALSTLGVVLTALLTGLFCHFVLGVTLLEGLLIGAIVSSTDAASVFSILRSRKLNLKDGLASLLEVESGSNDPIAYMLTMVLLSLLTGSTSEPIWLMLIKQIIFGLGVGFAVGFGASFILKRINFEIEGLYPIFVAAIAILSFAIAEWLGGNAYLSVYLTGIVLGNQRILYKKSLVRFFDGIGWLMQILLFFSLGLLCFPSRLPNVLLPGILISLFMILIARPAAVFGILSCFRFPLKQKLLVSWVGLRGAASIAFAILAVTYRLPIEDDIFHIVFFVALFSVAVQGSLIPTFSKKLDLVEGDSVLKTFNDYQEDAHFIEVEISQDSPWAGKRLDEAGMPRELLAALIKRQGAALVPRGSTKLLPGDTLVLAGNRISEDLGAELVEVPLTADSPWVDKTLAEADIPKEILVVMVRRRDNTFVPSGTTRLKSGDVLILSGLPDLSSSSEPEESNS